METPAHNVRFWQSGLTRSLDTARIRVPWSHNQFSDGQGEALSNEPSMSSTFFVAHRDRYRIAILSAVTFKTVNRKDSVQFNLSLKLQLYVIQLLYNLTPYPQRSIICKSGFKGTDLFPFVSEVRPGRQVIARPIF